MRILLFVCTGNSCRSVMAKALCERLLRERGLFGGDPATPPSKRIFVMSAGVGAVEGMPATFETRSVLRNLDADIAGHRSTRLTEEMVRHAELIFVMEEFHREQILKRVPEAAPKVLMLRTFGLDLPTAAGMDATIMDPIGKPLEVYEVCCTTIKDAVERVVKHVESTCESP